MTRIHHVYANRSNAGDWLSALGIQQALGDVQVVEHFCDDPFVPETLDQLSRLTSADLVVIGGGGLLMDYFVPFWDGLLDLDVRFCIWGIGVVDLKREKSLPPLDLMRRIGSRAELAVVRDERSAEAIGGGVRVAPCPSLLAVAPEPIRSPGLLHVANLTTVGEREFHRMRAVGERWSSTTSRVFRETNNRHNGDFAGLQHILERYKESDVVLSSALHGCLVAVAMGRPVVAVSGDHKIDEMMRQAGLEQWLLGQDGLDFIAERLNDALERQRPATGFLEEALLEGRRTAEQAHHLLGATSGGSTPLPAGSTCDPA